MKARWTHPCERCKTDITVGSQFAMFAGRRWHTACLLAYQRQRRELKSHTV